MKTASIKTDFLLTVLQRVLFILGLCLAWRMFDLNAMPHLRDGGGYLNIASGFVRGSFAGIPIEDTQYFIGYPLLLSGFLRFLTPWMAVFLLQYLCLAALFYSGARFFSSPWILRWLMLCIPSCVLFTSLNMSESLILALAVAVLLFYQKEKFFFCALALGYGLITRPQSMFFLYGLILLDLVRTRKYVPCVQVLVTGLFFTGGMLLFNQTAFHDSLHNFRLYQSHESQSMVSIPFMGYLSHSLDSSVRLVNRIYIWLFTLFTAGGLLLGYLRRKILSQSEKILLGWGILQFLFLLSLNSRWGFMELPRYFITILPASLLGYEPKLPKSWILTGLAAAAALAFAIYAEASGNRYSN